ncbi:MAG: Jag N-terminal domain-containing protein [Ruminococcus sp.]|nr:Jag N-terminal domain-containing protein [Ruminococcus sp.]
MTEIFTAKTIEEAKRLASVKFNKKISEIRFEVIEEAHKGFLGIGAKDAKVKAVYLEKTAPVKKQENNAEKKSEPVKPVEEKKPQPIQEVVEPEETVENSALEVAVAVEEQQQYKDPAPAVETPENAPEDPVETAEEEEPENEVENKPEIPSLSDDGDEEDNYSLDNFTLTENDSDRHPKVKLALDYITSILRAMQIETTFTVYQNETGAIINIESSHNGTVIGRRGETLDSIQYLCSIIANKGDKDYFRITIDCLGYRQKRRETLEQLAVKVSKTVLRTGRSQPLEPMNPYERRVIHSAISAIDGVSSHSVGEEPYRKIIITSDNPRRNNKKRGDRRDSRKNDRRNSRPRNPETYERKKVDLSTSFEKDYKRPRPEDSIEGGLYGKIEL